MTADTTLLKKLETAAQFQTNSAYAIVGSLLAGLGCIIGTKHFLSERFERCDLHTRVIVELELKRTLHICQMVDQASSFAIEKIRALIRALVLQTVAIGKWEATALICGKQ